ncbi:MAG TPA: OsmC family peroxiredoxin [Bacteriovoracaceae bacterium]|nr:OsmC family peroxiredoxin [Bacteriovoracaceae bacterium]
MIVHSKVNWEGSFKEGTGYIHSGRGAYQLDYTYKGRIGDAPTTNPEELISSAHAACYAMALRFSLEKENIDVDHIEVVCKIEAQELKVKGSHLTATIASRQDQNRIREIAERAKEECPISMLLNCPITLDVIFSESSEVSSYS